MDISLETRAYERALADAGRLEREIVQANLGTSAALAAGSSAAARPSALAKQ